MMFSCSVCRPSGAQGKETVKVDIDSVAQRQAAAERLIEAQKDYIHGLTLGGAPTAPMSPGKSGTALPVAVAAAAAVEKRQADHDDVVVAEKKEEKEKLHVEWQDPSAALARETKARQEMEERVLQARAEAEQREEAQRREAARAAQQAEEAAMHGRVCAAFLQVHGFKEVNAPKSSCFGMTYPLHRAVERGDPQAVRALLFRGANSSQKDSAGRTASQLATKKAALRSGGEATKAARAEVLKALHEVGAV